MRQGFYNSIKLIKLAKWGRKGIKHLQQGCKNVTNRIPLIHLQINEEMHSSTLSHLPEHTHNSTGVSILHTPSCTCFTSWKTKFPMSYELFIGSYEQSLCRDNAITLADDYFTVRGQKSASVPHRKNRQTFLKASESCCLFKRYV